jgi:hypothetical protein
LEQQSTTRLIAFAGIGLLVAAIIAVIRLIEFNQAMPPEAWLNASKTMLDATAKQQAAARAKWELQGITHYELVIERISAPPAGQNPQECIQDFDVRDEVVDSILSDTCSGEAGFDPPAGGVGQGTTINGLFGQIAAATQELVWSAEGTGCSFLVVDAAYDDNWGYPHRIAYRWQPPPPEFGYPIDSRYFLPGTPTPSPKCASVALVDGPTLTIKLTVLP